jgi:hypothetical protein
MMKEFPKGTDDGILQSVLVDFLALCNILFCTDRSACSVVLSAPVCRGGLFTQMGLLQSPLIGVSSL